MDVRFVTRKWPPAIGGMETYSVQLTREMARRATIEVIALPGKPSGLMPSAVELGGFAVRAAATLLTRPAARIVHIADLASWPLGLVASLRHPRTTVAISAHGSDVSIAHRKGWVAAAYRAYLRLGSRLLPGARIIANSIYVADLAKKVGFARIAVVPLGTNLSAGSAAERDNLLYAGRISAKKGLRFVVEEVLPQLPDDISLRVAGTIWEDSERALLDHPRVNYVGVLPAERLAEEYARAAAVIVPTRESEGFGLVAIEAAACGAFVIASAHSGLIDLVRPPIGITVPADDPDAWARAIRDALARNDAQRAAHARAAQMHVEQTYRWPRVAEETWMAYGVD